jgi:uncharacterized membrane protein (DUF2068 family)
VDWSTLACGRYGHLSFAPDEPALRAQMVARQADGEAWQCLRCGAFVPGLPALAGPAAGAPVVPRGREVRSKFILRLFAVERFVRAIIFGAAAYGLWQFRSSRISIQQAFNRELPVLRALFRQLGFNIDHSKLVGLVERALTLSTGSLTWLALGIVAYAAIEVVEGTGLWLARRWGEYFAMIATSLGLPLEIYDLSRKVTVTTLVLLGVNLALVLYLVITKRLFGIRGGKKAYDSRLRSESVLEAAQSRATASTTVTAQADAGAAQLAGPGADDPRRAATVSAPAAGSSGPAPATTRPESEPAAAISEPAATALTPGPPDRTG